MSQYFAKLCLKPDTTPKFWRPRPVPFALKDGIERELDKLLSGGIIEPIVFSEWAALFASVLGGKKFTILDLSQAYQQMLPAGRSIKTSRD